MTTYTRVIDKETRRGRQMSFLQVFLFTFSFCSPLLGSVANFHLPFAAYDFLDTSENGFNVNIWYNSTYKNDTGYVSIALLRVPRSLNAVSARVHFIQNYTISLSVRQPKLQTHMMNWTYSSEFNFLIHCFSTEILKPFQILDHYGPIRNYLHFRRKSIYLLMLLIRDYDDSFCEINYCYRSLAHSSSSSKAMGWLCNSSMRKRCPSPQQRVDSISPLFSVHCSLPGSSSYFFQWVQWPLV